MHKEILDYMMANTCHHQEGPAGLTEFIFDLHCLQVTVMAMCETPAPWDESTRPKYKIVGYVVKDV